MAAVIPEAAGAVTEGQTAVQGAGAAARARPPARAAAPAGGRQRQPPARQRARRAGRTVSRARLPGGRNYQPVILAEFLLAVLVVALAPIAKGGTSTAKAKGSPSPYDTGTLKQILIIGLVYFILALVSSGRSAGRVAAWFGGLVLVGIGVQQTVNGGFAAVLHMFGLNVGSGLGTFPATGDSGQSLLPGLNLNVGQFAPGALAAGVSQTAAAEKDAAGLVSGTFGGSSPTDAFPVIEPGGTIVPASSSVSSSSVSVPAGQTGVVTTGLPPGRNLA